MSESAQQFHSRQTALQILDSWRTLQMVFIILLCCGCQHLQSPQSGLIDIIDIHAGTLTRNTDDTGISFGSTSKTMLYLISGTSRSGKTILAKKLLQQKNLAYLSLDWLMMGFNDGIPEYGIHHLLMPDDIATRMWSFLQGMIENMLFEDVDYVIEGEAMLPELIATQMKKYPGKIRAVFVGFSNIDVDEKTALVKKHSYGENDWLTTRSDAYITDHISNMIAHSKMIKEGCEKVGIRYVDTSDDFLGAIETATQHLIGDLN